MISKNDSQNTGYVVSINGSVIVVKFPDKLPDIRNQLKIGKDGKVIAEVITHLSPDTAEAIAFTPPRE